MVLETLISSLKAEIHPRLLLVHGFIFASAGILLSFVFSYVASDAPKSLIMVFLTTMAVIPLVYKIVKLEEKKDLSELTEKNLLREHWKALSVFMYYFVGATLAYAFWYCALPSSI